MSSVCPAARRSWRQLPTVGSEALSHMGLVVKPAGCQLGPFLNSPSGAVFQTLVESQASPSKPRIGGSRLHLRRIQLISSMVRLAGTFQPAELHCRRSNDLVCIH